MKLSGFVDDTNAALNDWQPQHQVELDVLLTRLTHEAQTWNDLLFISGGKLELTKCSFHVLQFNFKPDGSPRPLLFTPPSVTLHDSESHFPIEIPGLRPDAAHKTLGHWKSPAGRQRPQLQAIMIKAKRTSQLIATAPLSRHGAKLAYLAKYVASLRFVLPQCFFSHSELGKAESKSIPGIIVKCGFVRKTAYDLLFSPTEMAGGGFVRSRAKARSNTSSNTGAQSPISPSPFALI